MVDTKTDTYLVLLAAEVVVCLDKSIDARVQVAPAGIVGAIYGVLEAGGVCQANVDLAVFARLIWKNVGAHGSGEVLREVYSRISGGMSVKLEGILDVQIGRILLSVKSTSILPWGHPEPPEATFLILKDGGAADMASGMGLARERVARTGAG